MDEYLNGLTIDELYALVSKVAFDIKDARTLIQKAEVRIQALRGNVTPTQIAGSLGTKLLEAKAAKEASTI